MKRVLALLAVATIGFGVMGASAATLGYMQQSNLGATSAAVYSCNDGETNDLPVTFQDVFSDAEGEYVVDTITISDASALTLNCQGDAFRLSLSSESDVQVPWHVEVTGTVPNTDPWVIQVFNESDIDSIMYSSDLAGIALTITDVAP